MSADCYTSLDSFAPLALTTLLLSAMPSSQWHLPLPYPGTPRRTGGAPDYAPLHRAPHDLIVDTTLLLLTASACGYAAVPVLLPIEWHRLRTRG